MEIKSAKFKKFSRSDFDMAGITEVLKGGVVRSEVARMGYELAASANQMAQSHTSRTLQNSAYVFEPLEGSYEALGAVRTASAFGRSDQAKNSTLNAINH